MGGQILAPFIMAPNTVGSLSVYIWYEFAEVGFPWRQLLPSFQAWLRGHSIGGSSQRTAAIMAIITTPTSLERECQVRDICDTRLTRALPRPPSLLSTADISTEQSRRSPGNPDTASESFSNPGQRKSSPTAEPLELARQMAGVFLAGKRGRIPGAEDERRGLRPRGAERFSGRDEQQKPKPASKAASTRRWPCTEGLRSHAGSVLREDGAGGERGGRVLGLFIRP
ncbi:uncharacterized protein LOC102896489 isoform X4 [Pteropus alecto]|uniref:uncharacterized protein LOC102896489 isoform X4 n=1 Tax=Pteropus alecto TaxID=9402 RepID=UPI000D531B7B|nr:uncharacterized protein LOC102896489 isoform X4 [Pteropus alecto]XP_024905939.1 uncharacterized protein LOC102896489 isoform X4 [Pteropus alecto]XP_024905940.1 uncharacterized protein LOC102896489 isoform X4 [Pteropus alecto]